MAAIVIALFQETAVLLIEVYQQHAKSYNVLRAQPWVDGQPLASGVSPDRSPPRHSCRVF